MFRGIRGGGWDRASWGLLGTRVIRVISLTMEVDKGLAGRRGLLPVEDRGGDMTTELW